MHGKLLKESSSDSRSYSACSSSIPFSDIWCVFLPPIFVHLPTQVYCMQSCTSVNMGGHGRAPPTPTKTIEGHGLGDVSLLCKNT